MMVVTSVSAAVTQQCFSRSSIVANSGDNPGRGRLLQSLPCLSHASSFIGLDIGTRISRIQCKSGQGNAPAKSNSKGKSAGDEEWDDRMHKETMNRESERRKERDEELAKESVYRSIVERLRAYPVEEVKVARKFVASLVKAGEGVEKMIEEAADKGELTPLVLMVIKSRLDVARLDKEKDAIQALDLLYRRVESEMLRREAPLALQLLDALLNLHDGFSRDEWLRRSRQTMLKVFPPEDAFTFLGGPNFDLFDHHGPIEMPEEEEDVLLRVDFIREVDNLLTELESQPEVEPPQGFDPQSIAIRLQHEERIRTIEQVRDLRTVAINLKW